MKVLVTVDENATRDGQIADFSDVKYDKDGDLIEDSLDWRDFYGEFIIGLYDDVENEDEAKQLTSEQFNIPIEHLESYILA